VILVLDYVLSKMVMLLFLMLTLVAFVMVKDSLADYFIQGGAVNVSKSIVTRISAIVTDTSSMHYVEYIPIAPEISGGNKNISYELNVLCKRNDSKTVLIGVGVYNAMGKAIGFSAGQLQNPTGDLDLMMCENPSANGFMLSSVNTRYLKVEKDVATDGSMTLVICPSSTGTDCDCSPVEVCTT
jgi:hypothetical protein